MVWRRKKSIEIGGKAEREKERESGEVYQLRGGNTRGFHKWKRKEINESETNHRDDDLRSTTDTDFFSAQPRSRTRRRVRERVKWEL